MTSVWGVSAVAILDCSLNVCACGRQKALTMPAYCVSANCKCNNPQATQSIVMHKFPQNQSTVRRKWLTFVQFKRADFGAALHQSCPFMQQALRWVRFHKLYGIPNGICFKVVLQRVTNLEKFPVRISKGSWWAANAQHDTKNWEVHWYPETSANKAKTKV